MLVHQIIQGHKLEEQELDQTLFEISNKNHKAFLSIVSKLCVYQQFLLQYSRSHAKHLEKSYTALKQHICRQVKLNTRKKYLITYFLKKDKIK